MRVGVLFMNEDSVVRDCRGGIVISTFGLSEHNILKPILKPSERRFPHARSHDCARAARFRVHRFQDVQVIPR